MEKYGLWIQQECLQLDGGNIIYINKKYHIVVAITGYFKPMVFDRVEYIEKNIVAALLV